MERLVTEASLSDSFLFTALNRSSRTTTTIASAIKTGAKVDSSFIEEQLIQCKRSRISPIMEKVLHAYETGEIILIYNKQVRVSASLPFVVMTVGNKTSAYIFISDFSGLTKDGTALNIEMKKLYVLMEAAYIGKVFYTRPDIFKRSTTLMKLYANIYAGMSMRIFNKEFALSLDKDIYDKVNYVVARFELEKMSELNNEAIIHNYAMSTCLNPSKMVLGNLETEYVNSSITNTSEMIKFVSTMSNKLTKLNFRYYVERWISTYGQSACLSIDALPYLNFVIVCTLLGGFLINVQTMSSIVKETRGINLFYSELSKIV